MNLVLLEKRLTRAASNRKRRKLEQATQPKLVKAFTQQGALFLAEFEQFQTRFTESLITDVLKLWLFIAADTEDGFLVPLQTAMETGLEYGALMQIAALGIEMDFDLTNEQAVAYLADNAAQKVKAINDTTRDILKTLITNGVRDGQSYTSIADSIKRRFAEFAGKVKAPRHIRSRAELIAVTEIGNAFAEGNQLVVRDLQAKGLRMQKHWLTRGDDRVSKGCRTNEQAGWIDLDTAYPSGDMRPLRFPGCRCDEQFRRAPRGS